jgi:hypothetical protein
MIQELQFQKEVVQSENRGLLAHSESLQSQNIALQAQITTLEA